MLMRLSGMVTFIVLASVRADVILYADEGAFGVDGDRVRALLLEKQKAREKERDALRAQAAALREQLEAMHAFDERVNKGFDNPNDTASRSFSVARWREKRADIIAHLTELPSSGNVGRIWSGSGLNRLLEVLGPAALDHELVLRKLAESRGYQTISPEEAQSSQFLLELSRDVELSPAWLNQIECTQGLTGPKLPLKLSFEQGITIDPLPLNWPRYMRQNKGVFGKLMTKIEDEKTHFLRSKDEERWESGERLRKLLDSLKKLSEQEVRRAFAGASDTGYGSEANRALAMKKFVRKTAYGAGRLIQMDSLPAESDFLVSGIMRPGSNGRISLISVLAVMHERGLQFDTTSVSAEQARLMIFEKMKEYYARLYAIKLQLAEQRQKTTTDLKSIDRQIQMSHTTERIGDVAGVVQSYFQWQAAKETP